MSNSEFTFLMCSERSGSNLITKMMNNHSRYCGPSPVHLMRVLLENRHRYGDLQISENWQTLLADARDLFGTKTGVWKTEWPDIAAHMNHSLVALIQLIYEKEARANQKERLFIKENHLYRYLPFIMSAFRGHKIVYLVRDPRDMALSWKRSPILRGSVIRAANIWRQDQKEGLRLLDWLLEQNMIHLIKYEQLVSDSEYELRKLCDFLEVEFEYAMLEFNKNYLTSANANSTSDWQNLKKPVMKQNFNKYKKGLSIDEIEYIEAVCFEEMERFGYKREYLFRDDKEKLEKKIERIERHEKEEYLSLPEEERHLRKKRADVIARIEKRPVISIYSKPEEELISKLPLEKASLAGITG